jgi:hypothetical protein
MARIEPTQRGLRDQLLVLADLVIAEAANPVADAVALMTLRHARPCLAFSWGDAKFDAFGSGLAGTWWPTQTRLGSTHACLPI